MDWSRGGSGRRDKGAKGHGAGDEFGFFFLFFWIRKKAGSLGKTWVFKSKVVCDL